MKFIRTTALIFFNLLLLCTIALAGNIINEGLFCADGDTLYYSETSDAGRLYAQTGDCKVKLSDLNARYINLYQGEVYFCSTDDTGEFAAISKYSISTGKVFTLYAVEMVKGIKNLYLRDGIAYFQSEGKVYSLELAGRQITCVLEDGEIVDFIPLDTGFAYTRQDDGRIPLYISIDGQTSRIAQDVSAFEASDGKIFYTDKSDGTINIYDISTGLSEFLSDTPLTNLIYDAGKLYGRGDDEYTIYACDVTDGTLSHSDNGIYSYFNIIDGQPMSVYYSGALLSKTMIETAAPIALTSYLPDTGTYKTWKQFDPRWANIQFPNGETIKQVGCLVTSIAILAVGAGVRNEADFNPGVFVESLKNNNGFSGASLYWSAVERVIPEFRLHTSLSSLSGTAEQKANTIAEHLKAGRKVVIRAVSNQHWVAADKVEDGKVYICDPGRNVTDLFSYYPADDVTRFAVFQPLSADAVKYESGVYTITSDDGLRLRSGPGLNYDKLSLIPYNAEIWVTDVGSEWGFTSYDGKAGWVFMQYTQYMSPLTYNINYDANGGLNSPPTQTKTHGHPLELHTAKPYRDGYLFLGWSADINASHPSYSPGALYTAESDITLYAVWQADANAQPILQGDADGNGVFNIKDIVLIACHLRAPDENPLTPAMRTAADLNGDGNLDDADLQLMRTKLATQ